MSYSRYAYAEAFEDEKQKSWVKAHVHMFEYFGGVSKILVPDNCKTAVIHNRKFDNELNKVYQELAEHYGTAVIPARVRTPKDKASAEGTVGNISTWIIAALRNQTFFSLADLNAAIRNNVMHRGMTVAVVVPAFFFASRLQLINSFLRFSKSIP